MHEIGVREVVTFAGMQFNIQTLEMTWLAMAIVILIAFLATRSLKLVPSGWQNVIEMVIVWLNEQIGVTLGFSWSISSTIFNHAISVLIDFKLDRTYSNACITNK